MKKAIVVLLIIALTVIIAASGFIYKNLNRYILYPMEYLEIIEVQSTENEVSAALILAVIRTESSFRENAISKKDAYGLMQITRETMDWLISTYPKKFEDVNLENLMEPEINIALGTTLLSFLLERYENEDTALAAYNAGMGRVGSWLRDTRYSDDGITLKTIPFTETKNYVVRIEKAKGIYEKQLKSFK